MHSLQDDRSGRVLGPCQVQREEGPGICHFPVFVVWMAYHRAQSVHHLGPGGREGRGGEKWPILDIAGHEVVSTHMLPHRNTDE